MVCQIADGQPKVLELIKINLRNMRRQTWYNELTQVHLPLEIYLNICILGVCICAIFLVSSRFCTISNM